MVLLNINILIIIAIAFSKSEIDASIHSTLRHFEIITPKQIQTRTRRDVATGRQEGTSLKFTSLGRKFHLSLTPGWTVVIPQVTEFDLVNPGNGSERLDLDLSKMYSGSIHGRTRTSVKAFHYAGAWTANIADTDERYVIEPLSRHQPNATPGTMVIYRTKDIIMTNATKRGQKSFCGTTAANSHRPRRQKKTLHGRHRRSNYRREFDRKSNNVYNIDHKAWPTNKDDYYKRNCDILSLVDYNTFRDHFKGDPYYAGYQILYDQERSSEMFKKTEFGLYKGVYNVIRNIQIMREHHEPSSQPHWNDAQIRVADANDILHSVMAPEFNNYCLVHLTTQRSFKGILGMANLGRSNLGTGLCSRGRNTLLTSMYSDFEYGGDYTHLITVAHEFGHSWGASHDSKHLRPTEAEGGEYIMWFSDHERIGPNNEKFSPESQKSIGMFLNYIADSCFISLEPRKIMMCGDGVVSVNEQCDEDFLFYNQSTNLPSCCTGICNLRSGAACSTTSSPCCTAQCQPAPTTQECFTFTTKSKFQKCHEMAYCDGVNPNFCPWPRPLPDGSPCGYGPLEAGRCYKGECVPHCVLFGDTMESCTCVDRDKDVHCHFCCRDKTKNGTEGKCHPTRLIKKDGEYCHFGICEIGSCIKTDIIIKREQMSIPLEIVELIYISIYLTICISRYFGLWCVDFDDIDELLMDESDKKSRSTNKGSVGSSYLDDANMLALRMRKNRIKRHSITLPDVNSSLGVRNSFASSLGTNSLGSSLGARSPFINRHTHVHVPEINGSGEESGSSELSGSSGSSGSSGLSRLSGSTGPPSGPT